MSAFSCLDTSKVDGSRKDLELGVAKSRAFDSTRCLGNEIGDALISELLPMASLCVGC